MAEYLDFSGLQRFWETKCKKIFAKKTGSYPNLSAGLSAYADNIVPRAADSVKDESGNWLMRTTAGSTSISDGTSTITKLLGNCVNGQGFMAVRKTDRGFNQWCEDVLNGYGIQNGKIVPVNGHKIAYLPCLACQSGAGKNNGYVVSFQNGSLANLVQVAYCDSVPVADKTVTVLSKALHYQSQSYLPTAAGYLVVEVTDTTGLCVHIAWSGTRDGEYEEGWVKSIVLPQLSHGYLKLNNLVEGIWDGFLHRLLHKIDPSTLAWSDPTVIRQEESVIYVFNAPCPVDMLGTALDNNAGISVGGNFLTISSSTLANKQQLLSFLEGKYMIYALVTEEAIPVTGSLNNECSDFGTEMFEYDENPVVVPSAVTIGYSNSYVDSWRNDTVRIDVQDEVHAACLADLDARISAIEKRLSPDGNLGEINVDVLNIYNKLNNYQSQN